VPIIKSSQRHKYKTKEYKHTKKHKQTKQKQPGSKKQNNISTRAKARNSEKKNIAKFICVTDMSRICFKM